MTVVHKQRMAGALRVMVLAPVPLLIGFAVIIATGGGNSDGDPVAGAVILLLIATLPVGFALTGAAFCKAGEHQVSVGFVPLFRKTFDRDAVTDAELIDVDPLTYGGWGIKGSATKAKGMLFSAGGQRALSLQLSDGRRYLVGCGDDDDAARRIVALLAPSEGRSAGR